MEPFDELARGARELHVSVERGDIAVHVGEGESWNLEWSADGDVEPDVQRNGHEIRVRQRPRYGGAGEGEEPGAFAGSFRRGKGAEEAATSIGGFVDEVVGEVLRGVGSLAHARLDLRLTVPAGVEVVELRSGHGRIDAAGVRGQLRLKSGHGDLSLHSAGGDADLSTGKGDVAIDWFEGTVTATTGYGRLRVERLSGQARLKSGNGEVEIHDSAANIRASSGNGDVTLAAVGGEVELKSGRGAVTISAPRALHGRATTGMGAIRVEGGSVGDLRLSTGMGAVSCSADLAPGTYELTTGMGRVDLALSATVAARVDAQTSFGQVQSDFPLVRVGRSGPLGFGAVRMVGSIGEGEPQADVSLRTGKGEISLRRAGSYASTPGAREARPAAAPAAEWPAQAPYARSDQEPAQQVGQNQEPAASAQSDQGPVAAEPERKARPDSTRAVLEALARHDITPAEAEDLLSGLTAR